MTDDKAADAAAQPKTEPSKLDLTQTELNEMFGKVRTETRAQSEKEIAKIKA